MFRPARLPVDLRGWAVGRSVIQRRLRPTAEGMAVIAAYYCVPVQADRELGVRVVLTAVMFAVLAVIVTRHVRRGTDSLDRLFIVLLGAIATLALAFYAAALSPGQFEGLATRTDALYFTVVTMATIGYGDIHPTGQLARVIVMLAVLFQVVFLTALVSTIARRLGGTDGGGDGR